MLGIALIAMGEDIGSQMSERVFAHLVSESTSHHFDLPANHCACRFATVSL